MDVKDIRETKSADKVKTHTIVTHILYCTTCVNSRMYTFYQRDVFSNAKKPNDTTHHRDKCIVPC